MDVNEENAGKAKMCNPEVRDSWNIGAETHIKIKTNNTTRVIIGIALVFMVASLVLLWRIRALEVKNDILQTQIKDLQQLVPQLLKNQEKHDEILRVFEESDPLSDSTDEGQEGLIRKRRQINSTNSSIEMANDVWSTVTGRSSNRKGGKSNRRKAVIRDKDQNAIAKLKFKLKKARTRANETKILASQTSLLCDTRAAYLVVNGLDVEIHQRGQHIGPWYIAENGSEYGFHGMWYQGLSLAENGTSVVFSESGLHLIYAQVYYTLFGKETQSEPLGFRIYIKKNNTSASSRSARPYQIAECVLSYPSTTYQTCFTQVAWYVEKGDQIYLQHFTSSLPLIEAEKMGQTFLGIVKLSGAP